MHHCFGRDFDGSHPERRLLPGVTATGARPERRIQLLRERSCRAGRCARCGCLGAVGLTACPRRLSLGRFVLAPLRVCSSRGQHPIRGCARGRAAALDALPPYTLRSCDACRCHKESPSLGCAVLICLESLKDDMCSANARPGAPGRIDCRIFPGASGFTPKAPYPGHTATCASGSEYLPSLEAATRIFTQLGELLRRARRRRLLS